MVGDTTFSDDPKMGPRKGMMNIRELISLRALDNIVQDQDGAVVGALEDKDVLVFGLLVVEDLVDLEGHGLARPHLRGFGEPSICRDSIYC